MHKVKILSTGAYHPKKIMTNEDISKLVDTNNEWIVERTGIHERRIADPNNGEAPSQMAAAATRQALEIAGMDANEIECIIFATTTPDQIMPNAACTLQQELGMTNNCAAVDLGAACSGFVYAFNTADAYIKTGMFKTVLVVGCDIISNRVDWTDRGTCILFGDGCGVAIVQRNDDENDSADVYSSILNADGRGKDFLFSKAGGAKLPFGSKLEDRKDQFMQMKGQEVFKLAVRTMCDNAGKVFEMANIPPSELDWLVPHQANTRIIDVVAKRFEIPAEKIIINIQKFGNTSAASVPIALEEAVNGGKIKRGDLVLLDAFGAGVTAGATLLRF